MLTGKNKERFEKFYADKFQQGRFYQLGWFYGLPLSMQFGVYVDYADSIGYDVYFTPNYDWTKECNDGYKWYCSKKKDSYISKTGISDNIDEASTAAIKAFDEIANRDTRKVKHKK